MGIFSRKPSREEGTREHLISVEDNDGITHPKIRVVGLERCTNSGTTILRGVSLDISAGSVVAIIGPSGSGKSTLLRALNRLWEPASKSVFLDGKDVTELDVTVLRRRVGMLFQTPTLFDGLIYDLCPNRFLKCILDHKKDVILVQLLCDLFFPSGRMHLQEVFLWGQPLTRVCYGSLPSGTVEDNVRMGPSLSGKKLLESEVEALLALADLDPSFAKKSVAGLSVGQAQRVALARTLANEPEVLLLDEPTSALDPNSTLNIEESIVKLQKLKGLTTVIVSHSISQVQRVANMVCILVEGQVVEVLKVEDLLNATHPLSKRFLSASQKSREIS